VVPGADEAQKVKYQVVAVMAETKQDCIRQLTEAKKREYEGIRRLSCAAARRR
jgi:hypothetical protein